MPTWRRCPCGHGSYDKNPESETRVEYAACAWHDALSTYVDLVVDEFSGPRGVILTLGLEHLDAVAALLREHALQRKRLNDEIGASARAEREARDAGYDDGYHDARREQEY